LVTLEAAWISSFITTSTPSPRSPGAEAARSADARLAGPSAPIALPGRCAPTSTTGWSIDRTWSSANAVSSSVAVPWVTTKPTTSGVSSQTRRIVVASACQSAGPRSVLLICSDEIGLRSKPSRSEAGRSPSSASIPRLVLNSG
jgi:hypothetical protein